MAKRDIPILLHNGKEVMMSDQEAKAYYNGLPRSDSAAGIFPLARYNLLMKTNPGAAAKLKSWYSSLQPNKWGTKIFPHVSNLNVPAVATKVPAIIPKTGNVGLKLSGKAKAQLAGMGVAGAAGMSYGGYTKDELDNLDINNNAEMLADLAAIKAKQQLPESVPKNPFPFLMTPGSRPEYDDIAGNLQATPNQDAMNFFADGVQAMRDNNAETSDDQMISDIMAQTNAEAGIGANIPQEFVPTPGALKMAEAIASVNGPDEVTNVKGTISSDPGYVDGYRVDKRDIAEIPQPQPKRAATVDPLNLFGNKNGYNPFSSKERKAAGKGKLSFVDFLKGKM